VGGGNDRIYAGADYTLYTGQSVEILSTDNNAGTAAIALGGNELDNTICGNDGNNILYGKEGNDTLLGLGGNDQFWFNTALGAANVDAIYGFTAGSDKLVLFSSIFAALSAGSLPVSAFVTGTGAGDADDRIIYNNMTGALLYDDDGIGAHAAVQFATLNGAPAITASDFAVI
jgi:Ca2+-binding RTX toxin-like protein